MKWLTLTISMLPQDIFKDIRFLILHYLYVSGIPQVKLCFYDLLSILGFVRYEDCAKSDNTTGLVSFCYKTIENANIPEILVAKQRGEILNTWENYTIFRYMFNFLKSV